MGKYSILIIYPGPVPPEREPERNLCHWISQYARGWFVQPIWWSAEEAAQRLTLKMFLVGVF